MIGRLCADCALECLVRGANPDKQRRRKKDEKQTLRHHPHLHCVVPGGGLSLDGQRWVSCRPGFFLSVNVLARLFRRLFLAALARAHEQGKLTFHGHCAYLVKPLAFKRLLRSLRAREWWVYAKPPFGGPAQVLAYLGRYTHRIAISNHRLLALKDGQVTFSGKTTPVAISSGP